MRYWIRDRESTPQGAPLRKLIRRLRSVLSSPSGESSCKLRLHNIEGQGPQVQALENALALEKPVPITFELLDDLSRGTDNWLSELDVECQQGAGPARFGLHGGTPLFFEAPRAATLQIVKPFKDIHPDPGWLGQLRP